PASMPVTILAVKLAFFLSVIKKCNVIFYYKL
ncbi:MAG: hypothetical protein ACI9YP_001293, partial [Colwellia sp.]